MVLSLPSGQQPAPVAGVMSGAETPEGKEVSHVGALWTDNKDILVMLSDMDINAIAGTLKLYFRELPEPLLTDRLYPAFMEGIGKGSGMGKGLVPKCGCLALSALGWETLEGPSHLSPLGPGHSCHLYASSGLVGLLPRVQDQSLVLAARRHLATMGPTAAHDVTSPCPEPSPSLSPALSDPAAKENCMMHLLRSLPDPNLITFLFLLEHLKR